ncbi:Rha family transcriptional regulator [Paenibacillus sp. FSL H8-0034]|uniref:Rha family transcriptional regulator n=1 Tax=Paenibacillus sp. FSL H8-0034 TaxID=2954671 RepID=UPI004046B1C9
MNLVFIRLSLEVGKIENIENFNDLNFKSVEYFDKKGENRPMYEMTRDGFMMLAMGFTGNLVCCRNTELYQYKLINGTYK